MLTNITNSIRSFFTRLKGFLKRKRAQEGSHDWSEEQAENRFFLSSNQDASETHKAINFCQVYCSFSAENDGEYLVWIPDKDLLSRHILHERKQDDLVKETKKH